MRSSIEPQTDYREAWLLTGLVVVIAILWDTPVVYPLRLLVVFFHEMAHGLAAVLTGGGIERIELVAGEGGLCITRGGSRFWTLTAGYLGSLVVGGVLLLVAARTRADRSVLAGLGVVLLLVTLLYVRPLLSFGFLFGTAAAATCLLVAAKLSERLNDIVLRVIGLTSCLYAPLDIKSDVLDRPELMSDAAMLADYTGLPTVLWGVIWIVIAVYVSLRFLLAACEKTPAQPSPSATAGFGHDGGDPFV